MAVKPQCGHELSLSVLSTRGLVRNRGSSFDWDAAKTSPIAAKIEDHCRAQEQKEAFERGEKCWRICKQDVAEERLCIDTLLSSLGSSCCSFTYSSRRVYVAF